MFRSASPGHSTFYLLGCLSSFGLAPLGGCVTPNKLAYFQPDRPRDNTLAVSIDSVEQAAVNSPITKGTILTIHVNYD